MKRLALFAVILAMSIRTHAATTIILVRHAEKAVSTSADMALSEAGAARAKELARVLSGAGVSAIYTTQYLRTKQTVAPLAEAMKVTPKALETGKTYPAEVVRDVLANHKGETVLVAGHSNTTVDVLRELGMKDPPFIEEPHFDNLFVCTVGDALPANCVALRYGAVTR
jgi:2,3-bisphosphoglycerate-dependent phosphoglycerate mutase